MLKIIAAASLLALTGCATMTQEEIVAQDDAACASYGVYAGKPEYFQCRIVMEERRARANAIAMAQFEQGMRDLAYAIR